MQSHRAAGFSLIEVMIVVAIIAILAVIALPGYSDYMRKGRRAAAVSAMQDAQLRLERWRVDHADYSGSGTAITNSAFYNYAIVAAAGTNNYSITATPQGNQAKDVCGTMSLTVTNGGIPAKLPATATCW